MKCTINNCERKAVAKGLCGTHRTWQKQGKEFNRPIRSFNTVGCSLKDCSLRHHAKGLCANHYALLIKNGAPTAKYNRTNKPGYYRNMPEYLIWVALKQRCFNPNNKQYHNYGGREITVCDSWTEKPAGFVNFINDIGRRPDPALSIDRINNDGNYEPGNVRWADAYTQRINQRKKGGADVRFT